MFKVHITAGEGFSILISITVRALLKRDIILWNTQNHAYKGENKYKWTPKSLFIRWKKWGNHKTFLQMHEANKETLWVMCPFILWYTICQPIRQLNKLNELRTAQLLRAHPYLVVHASNSECACLLFCSFPLKDENNTSCIKYLWTDSSD